MKESYIRSKVELRPLNTGDFNSKKNIVDYQQYEEQLSYYQKSKRGPDISQLFDWTKPSQILTLKKPAKPATQHPQPQAMPNNSMNTEELLGSEHGSPDHLSEGSDQSDSIDVQMPSNSKPTYVQQVKADYGSEYRIMSTIKIENELRQMRERIIQMNKQLNKMLDRYELLAGTMPRKEVQIQNPYKFLSKQIEINCSLLEKQTWQIKQIELKDKELEKKDYLAQLDEVIKQLKKQIHDIEKQKHSQSVDVQKVDKQLKEFQSIQQDGEQYKQVKELKSLIVYYFKKLNDQKQMEEQLQNETQNLTKKESDITYKLNQLAQIAINHNLQVSTNKNYNQLKRRYDQLIVVSDGIRKKKEVQTKSINIAQQKLQKQISSMKKQLQKCEMDIQQTEYKSMTKDEQTNMIISKSNILTRQLKSISYKFDQSLIQNENPRFKPNFKRGSTRLEQNSTNKTIDVSREPEDKRFYAINDKNSVPQFIPENIQSNNSSSQTSNSRLKPILRSWKGKPAEKQRYMASPQKYNTIERSNIFKPPPLLKARK